MSNDRDLGTASRSTLAGSHPRTRFYKYAISSAQEAAMMDKEPLKLDRR